MKQPNGFTLVELSIVLVIIGLIIGGVMVGQNMIKSSQVQSVLKEVEQYRIAIRTFDTQYNSLPGDITNASDFWTGASNGTGDRIIGWNNSEGVYMWNHLSRAGLVPGSYTGTITSFQAVIGVNVPESSWPGSGYSPISNEVAVHNVTNPPNFLMLGRRVGSNPTHASAFTPEEAHRIDSKIDDDNPSTGFVWADDGYAVTGCVIGATRPNVTYNMAQQEMRCKMLFPIE